MSTTNRDMLLIKLPEIMKWRLVHLEHCWDASPKSNPNTNLFFPQNDLRPVRTVAHSLFGCCAVENQIRRTAYYQRNHNLDILSAAYSWNWRVCVCVLVCARLRNQKRKFTRCAQQRRTVFAGRFRSTGACKMQVKLIRFRIDLIGVADTAAAASCTSTRTRNKENEKVNRSSIM